MNGSFKLQPNRLWIWVMIALMISFVLALAVSGLNPFKRSAAQHAPLDEFTAYLDERIPALMEFYAIPGSSMALVKDGKVVWMRAYGCADKEDGKKLTVDTPMRVQSIAKPVTAWGVMKLVEDEKIELDSPVTQYLKNWQFPASGISAEQVTVRQLLSHTAGLPLGDVFTIYAPEEAMPSLEEKLTKEAVLMQEPGTAFFYSNTGYNLLELMIEEVTGQDFAEYMEQEILIPLGMNRSTYVLSEALNPLVPVGYNLKGKPVPAYVYPEKGSGGLFATAQDVATFLIAGMPETGYGKHVLGTLSIEALYRSESSEIGVYGLVFDSYGMGHYIEKLPNGQRAVSHGGQGTGIMTHFHSAPESGDAIVILTNSQRSWPFISYLLGDWAHWCGFPSVGMERIVWAKYGLWAVVGLMFSAVFLQALWLTVGIIRGNRRMPLSLKRFGPICFAQAGLAVAIIGGLAWCLSQKYLFLTSVFPRASLWLGISAFALAVILLASALFPQQKV